MALQEHREIPIWKVLPVIETVSGFEGARLVSARTETDIATAPVRGLYSNARRGMTIGYTFLAATGSYDPAFVMTLTDADAAAPEARFDNVVDMLDWLNRD